MSNTKKIYAGGHCLTRGSQMQRKAEAEELRSLGHELFNPMEAAHNNKASADQTGLAERIVRNDSKAIMWADTVVIEPLSEAIGSNVEVGQMLGLRDLAEAILELDQQCECDRDFVNVVRALCQKQVDRKVYPHIEDIRLSAPTGEGYRSTYGINAYTTGACIKLANDPIKAPDGFYSWGAIIKELTPQLNETK